MIGGILIWWHQKKLANLNPSQTFYSYYRYLNEIMVYYLRHHGICYYVQPILSPYLFESLVLIRPTVDDDVMGYYIMDHMIMITPPCVLVL